MSVPIIQTSRRAALVLALAFGAGSAGEARAQADANAVRGAADAFGFRRGDESVGIYDERSVRGFNLESAGNYRIEGTYFVRNSGVSSFFLESTTVRIGASTLGVLLPGPSGVVDYRLRDPQPGDPNRVTVGMDFYRQPYAELHLQGRTHDGAASWSLGAGRVFDVRDGQGGSGGESLLLAGVLRRRLPFGEVRLFGGDYGYERPGQFRVGGVDPMDLPRIPRGHDLGQPWAMERGHRRIAGLLFDTPETGTAGAGATLVVSQEDPTRAFVQIFRGLALDGSTAALELATPHQRSTAWSGEVRGHLAWSQGALAQRIDISARGRRSRASIAGAQPIDLGRVPFGQAPAALPAPALGAPAAALHDAVDQTGLAVSYRARLDERWELNAGVMRIDYRKTLRDGAARRRSVDTPWLYNVAARYQVSPRLAIYAGQSRGLEEAGVAPPTARNANAILPAIRVQQREVSVLFAAGEDLNLVLGTFEIRKPYAGIAPGDGAFRGLGDVRHSGVEGSFSGRISENVTVVLGAVLLRPRLESSEPEGGLGDRPVGVPRVRAVASMDFAVPGVTGLNVDAAITYVGERPAASGRVDGRQPQAQASYPLSVGARYAFAVGGRPVTARVQVSNLFSQFRWDTAPGDTLAYTPGRQLRVVLTSTL